MTSLTGHSIIAGSPVAGRLPGSAGIEAATGEPLQPVYTYVDHEQLGEATQAAADAFDTYRATSPAERAAFLHRVADEIEADGEAIVTRAVAESGLPLGRLTGELGRTTGQLRMFAEVVRVGDHLEARIDPALPDRTPLPKPDLRQRQVPLGPVAVFSASNFPLAFSVAGGDTASALAAGCPVIVKAHPAHPGTSELVGRAIRAAVRAHNLPDGTFSLVFGSVATGIALVNDPRVRAVGFTGSRKAGIALTEVAAARPIPIPVYAEMSSVNPVFMLPGALAERAEALGGDYIASVTTGNGQLCTSPGLVFVVDGPDAEKFISAAAQRLRTRRPHRCSIPGSLRPSTKGSNVFQRPTKSSRPQLPPPTHPSLAPANHSCSSPLWMPSSPAPHFRTRFSARHP